MITDYKGVDLSLKKRKIKIIRIFFVLLILSIIYFYFNNLADKKKIILIQELLLQNKTEEAQESFNRIKNSFYHKKSKNILDGIFLIYSKEYKQAQSHFKTSDLEESLIKHNKFINYFIENLKYRELKIYLNFIGERQKNFSYYMALLSSANFDYKNSEKFIKSIKQNNDSELKKKIKKLKAINKELKKGIINYIFDINGSPIAYYNIRKGKTYSVNNFKGFFFNKFSNLLKNGIRYFTLTINQKIQNKINKIFKKYRLNGSFILLKTKDNSIVAAFSNNKQKKNTVFFKEYEPGSIVKLLTLYAYFKNNIKNIFPYKCKSLKIDNKPFYDWISHNNVESYEDALAWSCNIGFAKIGINLGLEKITKTYSEFLFNKKNIKDMFFNFKMGSFYPSSISDNYDLAKVSVGLSLFNNDKRNNTKELITMTTIHSGLLSSTIANIGVTHTPFLIKNIKGISSIGHYNHKNSEIQNINSPLIFNKIKSGMLKVVTDQNGTGKNSHVSFVKIALKTGTAGKNRPFNAIMTGFFPANRPEYAFAFILEKSGPSKDKGAKFLKDFLNIFYNKGEL